MKYYVLCEAVSNLLNTLYRNYRYRNYIVKKINFVSLWFAFQRSYIVQNSETLCSISSIIRVESRIEEFYRIPFNTIGDSYENKKRIGWTDSKRTDARDDGAWQKRRRAKFGRQGDGGKAKSNLIHTISSRRIGGPCNRVRIVGTSFWRVGRTWQNILHFRDEVSCDCNFATTFISR